jgi:hypothetical protein
MEIILRDDIKPTIVCEKKDINSKTYQSFEDP